MISLAHRLYHLEEYLVNKEPNSSEDTPRIVSRRPRNAKRLIKPSPTLPDDTTQGSPEKVRKPSFRKYKRVQKTTPEKTLSETSGAAPQSDLSDSNRSDTPASSLNGPKVPYRGLGRRKPAGSVRPVRRENQRPNLQKIDDTSIGTGGEHGFTRSPKPGGAVERLPGAKELALPKLSESSHNTFSNTPLRGMPTPSEEHGFTKILDFYGLKWTNRNHEPLNDEDVRPVSSGHGLEFYLEDENISIQIGNSNWGIALRDRRVGKEQSGSARNYKIFQYRDFRRVLWKYADRSRRQARIPRIEYVLLSTDQIRSRVIALGSQISAEYRGKTPVFVGILNGAIWFLADLVRAISLPLTVDFMGFSKVSQEVPLIETSKHLEIALKGKDVIIVDNLVDTGLTLNHAMKYVSTMNPKSLVACVLARNSARDMIDRHIQYLGFDIRDEYTVGYGSEFLETYRNLPFVGVVRPDSYP
jgi:hypoxanthine phosphoribosyltransferase